MDSTSNPKITLFLPDLTGGGAERVMVNLANGFAERGIRVDFVLVRAEGAHIDKVASNVSIVDLNARGAMASIPSLARYLRRERPQALISGLNHANTAAVLARALSQSRSRVVVTVHSTFSRPRAHGTGIRGRLLPHIVRLTVPFADEIVAVSDEVAEDFSTATGIHNDRISTIYNPVVSDRLFDQAKETPDHPWFHDDEGPVLVAVGRLTRLKGFHTLLDAFAGVRAESSSRLILLGEGDQRANLERKRDELGLRDSVSMPGFVNNPYAYLAHADLFVLSSLSEGLPTVLIEALALGIPVVSTHCKSGPREILRNGVYGRLVPPGDPHALEEAIRASLSKPVRYDAAEAVSRFRWDTAIDAYLRTCALESYA